MALVNIDNLLPRLAVRKGIAWGIDAPIEDSDVLHMCLPSGHFTDTRFATDPAASTGLLWAFAGRSTFARLPDLAGKSEQGAIWQGWSQNIRGEFAHPIDSTGNFTDNYHSDIIDLGSGNGDQLETGMLGNPETGAFIHYKEFWTLSKDTTLYPCARAVFEREGEGHGLLAGQIIRVGNHIQGVRQVKEKEVDAGRWVVQEGGEWKVDPRSTPGANESFPVDWLAGKRKVGDRLEHAGREWRIEEAVEE